MKGTMSIPQIQNQQGPVPHWGMAVAEDIFRGGDSTAPQLRLSERGVKAVV